MSITYFNPHSKHPARAVQAWQILVGKAMRRQTVTYEGLSILMYQKKAAGVLAEILGHIAYYCKENNLPMLNSIVVGKHVGAPGENIPIWPGSIDEERERVYSCDWYDIYPPSDKQLSSAFANYMT